VYVCVARFAPQKAHDVLLRALATRAPAAPRTPRAEAAAGRRRSVGDGRTRMQALARDSAGRTPSSRHPPRRAQLLGASDVYTMASLWEGLGLVF